MLPIAVDAFEQSEHRRSTNHDHTTVLAFIKAFRQQPRKEIKSDFPLETSKALLQLDEVVRFFVMDFARNLLAIYEQNAPSSLKESSFNKDGLNHPVNLSRTEHSRIARAFYNLELYGNLFSTPPPGVSVHENPSSLSGLFLLRFRDWELEEMLCVRQYLSGRLSEYIRQVEDDFMESYAADEGFTVLYRARSW